MKEIKVLCNVPFEHCMISTNGDVRSCCYQSPNDKMGNLNEQTFDEIWDGDKLNNIRKQMINMEYPEICKCLEQTGKIGLHTQAKDYYIVEIPDGEDVLEESKDREIDKVKEFVFEEVKEFNEINVCAFYYIWYFSEKQWTSQTSRFLLKERQLPYLGNYDSLDDKVIERHIDLANKYGIDCFIVCLTKELIDSKIAKIFFDKYYKIAKNKDKYPKLSIQIETLSFVDKQKKLNKQDLEEFRKIYKYIEHNLYDRKFWLLKEGKDVLFFYVTREIVNIKEFTDLLRELYKNVYLVGDEVWYGDCNIDRIRCFDAVYGYNQYLECVDYNGFDNTDMKKGKNFISMANQLNDLFYGNCLKNNVEFIPSVIPRYNDRGVRLDKNHYVIPEENGCFFKDYLYSIKKYIKNTDMVLVTSFNEWYEDTQIEPTGPIEDYRKICSEPVEITEGYEFKNYGEDYLKIIKEFKDSITNINKEEFDFVVKDNKQEIVNDIAPKKVKRSNNFNPPLLSF